MPLNPIYTCDSCRLHGQARRPTLDKPPFSCPVNPLRRDSLRMGGQVTVSGKRVEACSVCGASPRQRPGQLFAVRASLWKVPQPFAVRRRSDRLGLGCIPAEHAHGEPQYSDVFQICSQGREVLMLPTKIANTCGSACHSFSEHTLAIHDAFTILNSTQNGRVSSWEFQRTVFNWLSFGRFYGFILSPQ